MVLGRLDACMSMRIVSELEERKLELRRATVGKSLGELGRRSSPVSSLAVVIGIKQSVASKGARHKKTLSCSLFMSHFKVTVLPTWEVDDIIHVGIYGHVQWRSAMTRQTLARDASRHLDIRGSLCLLQDLYGHRQSAPKEASLFRRRPRR